VDNKLPTIKKSIFLLLTGFGLGVFVAMTYSMILMLSNPGQAISNENLRIALLVGELIIPLPIVIWVCKNDLDIKQTFRFKSVKIKLLIPVFTAGLSLIIIIDEIDRLLSVFFEKPENISQIQELMKIDSLYSGLIIVGVIIFLGPFVEEIVFRGFFQQVLEEKLGNITSAVLISAFTFAVLHFNPWWVIQIYILGFFMAFLAYRTDSILLPFFIHALNNGISVVASQFEEIELAWYLWAGHVNPVILVLSVFFLLWGVRRFIRHSAGDKI
jgi:hypothetical protein